MPYGTLSILDSLAASTAQTVAQIGEDRVFENIRAALEAHNALVEEALADFVDITEDRDRRYGGSDDNEMVEVDEFGRADAAKSGLGATVAFPLRRYQRSLQWTRDYFEITTGAEFAAQVDAVLKADAANMHRQIRRALFRPTNYTFTDHLINHAELPVKALINADSTEMPLGPNGETFNGATHTHYLATASFVVANLDSLIDTIIEHFGAGQPVVEFNQAQEATVRAFTGFAPLVDTRIVQPTTGTYAMAPGGLDVVNIHNRMIGYYRGAEIWIKTQRVPSGYALGWMRGATQPLAMRRRNAARGALRLVADNESFPLRAQTREREFGIGVWNRVAAAVMYLGGGSYVEPTL
jgi:hypothetical protein